MTVCPMHPCFRHLGTDRTACGGCGVTIITDRPGGRAVRAYDVTGRLVYTARQNAALENEARWADTPARAVTRRHTALSRGDLDIDLIGMRQEHHAPIGRMHIGKRP